MSKTILGACATALAVVGCDSPQPTYPVGGTVLIDGSPVTKGTIRFVPKHGRPATSKIDGSGRFQVESLVIGGRQDGLVPGIYRVAVTSNEIVDEETARWLTPAKYADFRTSGLEVNVDRPLDDVKIELSWEGEEKTADVEVDVDVDSPTSGPQAAPDETPTEGNRS